MGRKGRNHFRILPLLRNHQLAGEVCLEGARRPTPNPLALLMGQQPPGRHTRKEILMRLMVTQTRSLEIVNSSEKAANSVSPSYSRQSFSAWSGPVWLSEVVGTISPEAVFPVFCFVSHWIRFGSPLVATCRKISWAGERCLVGVRSLSSSHFFPLPPQAISNYFIRH